MSAYARLWSANVVAIEFGGKPNPGRLIRAGDRRKEIDAYVNMVTALWYCTRHIIEAQQMRRLPRACAEEGAMREWVIKTRTGTDVRVCVEPKDKTKERMGRSPDLFDSLVCGIEMARRRGFEIGGIGMMVKRAKQPNWIKARADSYNELRRAKQLTF